MPDPAAIDYVFGYGSLVALQEPLTVAGVAHPAIVGGLRGFRRVWGAAMNNWETTANDKHYVEPGSERKPKVRVAYLDVEEDPDGFVNGLAIPVDSARLAELDAREINYSRVDLSPAFEPALGSRVFVYRSTADARARLETGIAEGNLVVIRTYVELVRAAFADLAPGALAEFERGTAAPPGPERELDLRLPASAPGQ